VLRRTREPRRKSVPARSHLPRPLAAVEHLATSKLREHQERFEFPRCVIIQGRGVGCIRLPLGVDAKIGARTRFVVTRPSDEHVPSRVPAAPMVVFFRPCIFQRFATESMNASSSALRRAGGLERSTTTLPCVCSYRRASSVCGGRGQTVV
jgi:hypothetical protein